MKAKQTEAIENPMWLQGPLPTVSISKSAEKLKKDLLAESTKAFRGAITHPDLAIGMKAMRDEINKVLIDVEKTRAAIKKPVLDKGREIDQCASTFTMDLTVEKLRLEKLLGDFARKQEEIRQAAAEQARKQQEEADRLLREQQRKEEEQRLAAERAERLRIGAEQAAAEAETKKERMAAQRAQEEADRVQAEADGKQKEAFDLSLQQGQAEMSAYRTGLVVADSQVKGVRPTLDFEVLDVNALYRVAPELVELTPKRRDILARLKAQQECGLGIGIAGIRVVERMVVR